MLLDRALLYDFELAGRRVRLWKRFGESYEHVLMKALAYAMFVPLYPGLEIERRVGLRYKPDLVAQDEEGRLLFWGECGATGVRKTAWLLKHTRVERLVLFKMEAGVAQLAEQLRSAIAARYLRPGRFSFINFDKGVIELTAERRIDNVPPSWYTETQL